MSRDREDEPGFASRWSRLKQEAKAEPVEAEAEPAAAEPEAPAADERPDDRSDEEVLEELGLPDPDTLKAGDNFAAFMAKAVPTRLRNRALRKLWVSDPVLANLDMLVDYGEDFTDAATVVENLQTAYQVGRGYIDKVAELSEEDAGSAAEPAEESPEESAEKPPEEPAEESAEAGDETGADEGDSAGLAEEVAAEETGEKVVPEEEIRVRQRMRFRLVEE
ncbi:MAG: DUF3306 domain-containing protein [Limibaculum sp.]